MRAAQAGWAARPVAERLAVLRRARHRLADRATAIAATVPDEGRRAPGETLPLEVLPLADAVAFLETQAPRLLAPRRLGRRGRPAWLGGIEAEIRREPLGLVLILGPYNYPLFLPGVQLVQALAAGNAVLVKPAAGCAAPVLALAALLAEAGLPDGVLRVLDDTVAAGRAALDCAIDKVVLTGSAGTGRAVLAALAPRLVPATLELSGCDAVFVLPGADLDLVTAALAWGVRLNGGATCIAPRRVFLTPDQAARLAPALAAALAGAPPVPVRDAARRRAEALLAEAAARGCPIAGWPGEPGAAGMSPVLVADAPPGLALLHEDLFAPVLALVPVADAEAALAAAAECPLALGAAIFGPAAAAQALAGRVRAGAVTINDLIAPTADPRLPFGGRGASGFGVTRGAEGLLEFTAVKTVSLRRGRFRPHYDAPRPEDAALFAALIAAAHGTGPGRRLAAAGRLIAGLGRRLGAAPPDGR